MQKQSMKKSVQVMQEFGSIIKSVIFLKIRIESCVLTRYYRDTIEQQQKINIYSIESTIVEALCIVSNWYYPYDGLTTYILLVYNTIVLYRI